MIAYHISRSDSLQVGQTINLMDDNSQMSQYLFGGKVSNHGMCYLTDCYIESFSSYIIETELEFDDSAMNDFLNELKHFEINCPECNHPFNIPLDNMGKTVTCPHCHAEIKLELK